MYLYKKHQGFGLLEVLIAAMVLSIGMLGTLTMQAKALRVANKAANVATANLIVADMAASMSVNILELEATDFPGAYSSAGKMTSASLVELSCNEQPTCLYAGGYSENPGGEGYTPKWYPSGSSGSASSISSKDCASQTCSATELAIYDAYTLRKKIYASLPQESSDPDYPVLYYDYGTNTYKIRVDWQEVDGDINTIEYSITNNPAENNELHLTKLNTLPYPIFKYWVDADKGYSREDDTELSGDAKQLWFQYLYFYFTGVKSAPPLETIKSYSNGTTIEFDDMKSKLRKAMKNPAPEVAGSEEVLQTFCSKLDFSNRYRRDNIIPYCMHRGWW